MQNEIIINAEIGETRVALLERGQFAELHIERERDKSVVGNVAKGRVTRVLPGMQAAFVDIGLEKAAFLYVGDYFESTLETGESAGEPSASNRRRNGRGRGGRSAPPRIDTVLHEGKEIVVQIAKEPIGTKGARITSSISIPGRHLVLTPWSRRVGVSRRISSDRERRRLREIVERLRPQNLGFIIRTAGDGVREEDLEADIRYLATVWAAIQKRHADNPAPAVLYSEHDLALRIVRDLAGHETRQIATDDREVYESIKSFVERFVAEPRPRIEIYDEGPPIFERFDLESQIHANLERKVWLKSGGSLVIDKSEALTAIDVNTGRFVGKRDLEETVLKTNLEAVQEVVRQLRFRNLGGLIIIDLIDMESAANRDKVYRALQEALRADKARTNILKISELGLVEMTRKRTRENLVQTLCEPCSYCEGRGYVLSHESVAFRVLREIRKHMRTLRGRPIAIAVHPRVAEELLSRSKDALAKLGEELGAEVEIRARPGLHQEQFELMALESGPPLELDLPWLRDVHPDAESSEKEPRKNEGGRRSRGRRGRGRSRETLIEAGEVAPEEAEAGEAEGEESDEAKEAPPLAEVAVAPAESEIAAQDSAPDTGAAETARGEGPADGPQGLPTSAEPVEPEEALAAEEPERGEVTTPGLDAPAREEASPPTAAAAPPSREAPESPPASSADDSPESAQGVDSETESRILPRSQ
ncbi:MAG: Rne/Rng family ribonuclease [Deltaproteobacteria bacterium]|jgi:ribonuclease G|nr:Rne/Rng family ribonuclease [Deltaproteobacteria bacterium]